MTRTGVGDTTRTVALRIDFKFINNSCKRCYWQKGVFLPP